MVINLLKLGLFLLSCFGYWEFFRARCRLPVHFAPVFTVACQFCVLFAAGILNYLKDAAIVLWLGGLLLLACSVRKEKWKVLKPYLTGGYLFCGLLFAAMLLCTHDRQFSQIDNFTHWATVVRNMLAGNRFPNQLDTAVEFTSYPLGSSVMIYYFCLATNGGESMQMLGQAFMMLCCILPVFAFVKKRQAVCTVLVTVMTGFLLSYNIPVTELLVDTLMPLAGMATVAFIGYMYWGEETPLPVYYAVPMLLWTMNIKHAALLYVAGAFVLLWIGAGKGNRKPVFYSGLLLAAARSVWNRHCGYIDPDIGMSQHTLSAKWFSSILGEKTVEDILRITGDFCEFAVTRRELLWLLAWMLVLSLLAWALNRGWKKQILRFLLCGTSMYVVYAAGLLGMYIFSMPANEGLAAVDRYMKSGDVAVYYLILIFAVSLLGNAEPLRGRQSHLAGLALLVLAAAGWWFQSGEYDNSSFYTCTGEQRQRWEAPIDEYGIVKRQSYLLLISAEDDTYRCRLPKYVWQYTMESSAVTQLVVEEEAQLEIERKYDYVIILDEENPVIQTWLRENYPDRIGSQVVQHFVEGI